MVNERQSEIRERSNFMARRKQSNPMDDVSVNVNQEPNGTGAAHAVLEPPEMPGDRAARGRRTNGAARPRGRKVAAAEVEVIAVTTEPTVVADAPPQEARREVERGGEQLNELRRQSEETSRHLQEMRAEVAQV